MFYLYYDVIMMFRLSYYVFRSVADAVFTGGERFMLFLFDRFAYDSPTAMRFCADGDYSSGFSAGVCT